MFYLIRKKYYLFNIVLFWLVTMIASSSSGGNVYAAAMQGLPQPGKIISQSASFAPVTLKGLKFDSRNPFKISFIIDEGGTRLTEAQLKAESEKLVRYFLAAVTTPGEDMWVNLSPYEQDRIVPRGFSQTYMGRDMLAQDYTLKQLTASLTHPDTDAGKQYWNELNGAEVGQSVFNRIWITPDITVVQEHGGKAFIVKSTLKVQMDGDYVGVKAQASSVPGELFKKYILPLISKEVNEGENFATFRQLHSAVVMAAWFKNRLKDSIYEQLYINKGKNRGIETEDPNIKEKIFNQYMEAFKNGLYNETRDIRVVNKISKRRYFAGGASEAKITTTEPLFKKYDDKAMRQLLEPGAEGSSDITERIIVITDKDIGAIDGHGDLKFGTEIDVVLQACHGQKFDQGDFSQNIKIKNPFPRKIVVASQSVVKIDTVRKVLLDMFPGEEFEVTGVKAQSAINEQPVGDETEKGALNRIESAINILRDQGVDAGSVAIISIENGIFPDTNEEVWEDKAVVAIRLPNGDIVKSFSVGVRIPVDAVRITQKKDGGFVVHTVGTTLSEMAAREGIILDKQNSLGYVTDGKFTRDMQMGGALRGAITKTASRQVGGITESNLKIEIKSDGTRFAMVDDIQLNAENFQGFTFIIDDIRRP